MSCIITAKQSIADRRVTGRENVHLRLLKTQISLRIRAVRSGGYLYHINVSIYRIKKLWIFGHPKCAQRRFWSDCACAVWSESLLGSHVWRYVFGLRGSDDYWCTFKVRGQRRLPSCHNVIWYIIVSLIKQLRPEDPIWMERFWTIRSEVPFKWYATHALKDALRTCNVEFTDLVIYVIYWLVLIDILSTKDFFIRRTS